MILQVARANIPWILMEADRDFAWTPDGADAGVGILSTQVREGLELRLFVDQETFRVVRSQGLLSMGGQPMAFETTYSDFNKLGGVLFPFAEETYAAGVHTASIRITHIRPDSDTQIRSQG
jgi:hypothetical protein